MVLNHFLIVYAAFLCAKHFQIIRFINKTILKKLALTHLAVILIMKYSIWLAFDKMERAVIIVIVQHTHFFFAVTHSIPTVVIFRKPFGDHFLGKTNFKLIVTINNLSVILENFQTFLIKLIK